MVNEEEYLFAFQLISLAGDAKTLFMQAIKKAKQFAFEEAEEFMKRGEEELSKVHALQTEKLQQECQGTPIPVNVILVHAQDHLTMALMTKDHARNIIDLYILLRKNGIEERV